MKSKSYGAWVTFAVTCCVAAAAPQGLVVDAGQSRVDVVVQATVDSFTGKLDAYQAMITVDNGRVVSAALGFNFADVHTGKDGRDEAMHAWQDTTKHPDGKFTLAALEPAADGRFTARGTLELHGVGREIVFPVSVITDHKVYAIDGVAALDTQDFGLPVIRKFGLLKVDPVVKVRFHLQGAVAVGAANKGGKSL
jgi:polyisoprenoid-binding protein YceI